jgi:MFS family permease
LANNYTQMLMARAVVGFGEAAYAAAGAALLAHTFPADKRAAVQGAFQSAGLFGSVLGVVIGGAVASQLGWRMAFFAVGVPGLLLAVVYPFFVRDYESVRLDATSKPGAPLTARLGFRHIVKHVFAARSGNLTLVGFGLQMAIPAILIAWVPSYFNRFYGFDAKKAAMMAAAVVLVAGIGMLIGGGLADRVSRNRPHYRALMPATYALLSGLILMLAFALPPSPLAMALVMGGALFAAAHGGSAVALLMDVTHPAVRATVTATAVVGATLLGMAPGPYLVGVLSDVTDIKTALTMAPAISIAAAVFFLLASRYYRQDAAQLSNDMPTALRAPA